MAIVIEEGRPAPNFALPDAGGRTVSLADFRGRHVIVYFYPKDDTPGCTREACEFRDRFPELEEAGAVVLGVSPDPVRSHVRFRTKHGLPFRLLADTDHRVAEAYGVWKPKPLYGRIIPGIERTTFVIDEEGRIARIFRKVKPAGHAAEVLAALG